MQRVEVETGLTKFVQGCRRMQRVEPIGDPALQR
jgi:hypothetical protein